VFLPLCTYLDHHYSNVKFLLYQFKPSSAPISTLSKAEKKRYSDGVAKAKTLDEALAFWERDKEVAREEGKRFVADLYTELERRSSGQPASDVPLVPSIAEQAIRNKPTHQDVWKERSDAEASGTAVDQARSATESVVRREIMDDEEAMMNGA
jgi:tRNA-dihydrouridine synthase 2